MNNNDISKQLKALKGIKPDQDWVMSTKSFILEPEHTFEKNFSRGFSFKFQPALAIPILMFVIIGSGVGINLTLKNMNSSLVNRPATTYLAMIEERLDDTMDVQEIKEVGDMIEKAANKVAKAPQRDTAAVVEQISTINKKIEELNIPELQEKTDVLTSVASDNIEDKIEDTTKALVENLMKILEIRDLSEENQELFTQAKMDYNNKNYNKALETILMLTSE
jgi:hypothetical protein